MRVKSEIYRSVAIFPAHTAADQERCRQVALDVLYRIAFYDQRHQDTDTIGPSIPPMFIATTYNLNIDIGCAILTADIFVFERDIFVKAALPKRGDCDAARETGREALDCRPI